jgi:hypothetical protein
VTTGLWSSRRIDQEEVHRTVRRHAPSVSITSTSHRKRPTNTTHRRPVSAQSRVYFRARREICKWRAHCANARKRQRRRTYRETRSSPGPRPLERGDVCMFRTKANGCLQYGRPRRAVSDVAHHTEPNSGKQTIKSKSNSDTSQARHGHVHGPRHQQAQEQRRKMEVRIPQTLPRISRRTNFPSSLFAFKQQTKTVQQSVAPSSARHSAT